MTPTISDRDHVRVFVKKVAILLVLVLLWKIRDIVVLLLISGVLAAGIAPAVVRVRVYMRRWFRRRISRGAAVLLVYLPLLIVASLAIFFGLPFLLEQSRTLMTDLPRLLDERIFTPLSKYMPVDDFRAMVSNPKPAGGQPVVTYVKGAATIVASAVAAMFIIFYMLIDAERLKNFFLLAFPSHERAAPPRRRWYGEWDGA